MLRVPGHGTAHLFSQRCERDAGDLRTGLNDDIDAGTADIRIMTEPLAQTPPGLVPDDRVADPAAQRYAESTALPAVGENEQQEVSGWYPNTTRINGFKLPAVEQSIRPGEALVACPR